MQLSLQLKVIQQQKQKFLNSSRNGDVAATGQFNCKMTQEIGNCFIQPAELRRLLQREVIQTSCMITRD